MRILNALVFRETGEFTPGEVGIQGGVFSDSAGGEVLDAQGCWALPGLIDLHFHGCMGHDFCDGTPAALKAIAAYQARCGVTAICPATMTFPEELLTRVCANAAGAVPAPDEAELLGIYLEGPFLAATKKGAQNAAWLQAPDPDLFLRLQRAAGGLIRLLALAPEEPGALELIDRLHSQVGIALGHTAADYDTALEAFRRGARQATHLYNAMPPFSHRAPGVVGAAADAPTCRAELIADGVHVHPSVVRATFRIFGDDRIILISDSMMATGLPDGAYELGGQPVQVRGSRCTLADGTIAGSATNLADCLRSAVAMGIPLGSAVKCAAINPAKALGVFDRRGSIAPGKTADLLLLDRSLALRHVFLRGRLLF